MQISTVAALTLAGTVVLVGAATPATAAPAAIPAPPAQGEDLVKSSSLRASATWTIVNNTDEPLYIASLIDHQQEAGNPAVIAVEWANGDGWAPSLYIAAGASTSTNFTDWWLTPEALSAALETPSGKSVSFRMRDASTLQGDFDLLAENDLSASHHGSTAPHFGAGNTQHVVTIND